MDYSTSRAGAASTSPFDRLPVQLGSYCIEEEITHGDVGRIGRTTIAISIGRW
jgi:hypothetical protein